MGCWKWGGNIRSDGRPILAKYRGRTSRYAYRLTWEMGNGPLPEGLILHHTCENTWCVRPDHLEPMTQEEHARIHQVERNIAKASEKTHCPQGHEYDIPKNRYGFRACSICRRAAKARYNARKRQQKI